MRETHENLLNMLETYPIGSSVKLKTDYPYEKHKVSDYKTICGVWYIVLSDGTSICMSRMDELIAS